MWCASLFNHLYKAGNLSYDMRDFRYQAPRLSGASISRTWDVPRATYFVTARLQASIPAQRWVRSGIAV